VVIFELCCLKAPYEALSIEELIRKQRVTKLKNIPTNYSCALNELIFEMLQTNPKKRISAEKIKVICLKHLKVSFE
jgi:serine/threonine protein kinase